MNNSRKENGNIIIVLAPDYANIGDVAINLAQIKIIKKIYPDKKIIEIPMLDYYEYKQEFPKLIKKSDIITIIGGGNMGNVYIGGEERRRNLISNFPENKIISFPQSVDFSGESANTELQKTAEIYSKHPDLTIFAREEKSYKIMKKHFNNSVYLVPDTVMYLMNKIDSTLERDKILLCFRNDKEKITDQKIIEEFVEFLEKNNFRDIEITDTHLENLKFKPTEKDKLFKNTINKFKSAKFVITDRLHGVIFSLITKTPCIAFDNSNHKISSTYKTWLKELSYIKLLDSFNENKIISTINEFKKIDPNTIPISFDKNFKELFNSLK